MIKCVLAIFALSVEVTSAYAHSEDANGHHEPPPSEYLLELKKLKDKFKIPPYYLIPVRAAAYSLPIPLSPSLQSQLSESFDAGQRLGRFIDRYDFRISNFERASFSVSGDNIRLPAIHIYDDRDKLLYGESTARSHLILDDVILPNGNYYAIVTGRAVSEETHRSYVFTASAAEAGKKNIK